MEHAQRMYLVDQRQLDSLAAGRAGVGDIRSVATQRLDAEMQTVLNRTDLPDHDKALLYSSILHKYLQHTRQGETEKNHLTLHLPPSEIGEATPPPPPPPSQNPAAATGDPYIGAALDSLTRERRPHADLVVRRLGLEKDEASWNASGEFVYKGNSIRGSSMYDLLRALTQKRRITTANAPVGWRQFTQAIADLNIPVSVAGNANLRRYLETLKSPEPPTPPSTPPSLTPPPPTSDDIWLRKGFKIRKPAKSITYGEPWSYDAHTAHVKDKHSDHNRQIWTPY